MSSGYRLKKFFNKVNLKKTYTLCSKGSKEQEITQAYKEISGIGNNTLNGVKVIRSEYAGRHSQTIKPTFIEHLLDDELAGQRIGRRYKLY